MANAKGAVSLHVFKNQHAQAKFSSSAFYAAYYNKTHEQTGLFVLIHQ